MKIFTYSASRRKESNTKKVMDYIVKQMQDDLQNIEHISYAASEIEIKQCIGCCRCFASGRCILDEKDHFDKLKQDLLDSQVIILGTPVYSAMVSGDMKIFIDRMSSFLHTMPLCSKIVILVISASGNSLIETNLYFKKIIESWGGFVPFSIMFSVDAPNMLETENFNHDILPNYINEIEQYVLKRKPRYSSDYQESYFKNLKKMYMIPRNNAEYMYWKDSGLLYKQSFQQVIDERVKMEMPNIAK